MFDADDIRNLAIIAHVDHGKTTLVDHMLRQSGVFRPHQEVEDRVMDSGDLEQERGITISSKPAAILHGNTKINLVDTPGHSDFGGEVERVLNMVEGALLLVDAAEGPLPQTRFVLDKALKQGLSIVLCVNKIDRDEARISDVVDEVFELFMELGASDDQLDFPIIYSSAIQGIAVNDPDDPWENLEPLFETIKQTVPPPEVDPDAPLQMLVSDRGHDEFVGRLAFGRIHAGTLETGQTIRVCREDADPVDTTVSALYVHEGLQKQEVDRVQAGEIVAVAGSGEVEIGDTITSPENPRPLPRISVEQPTVSVEIMPNDGPFSGREGEFVTGRKLLERLRLEDQTNVAIRLQEQGSERWKLHGRGQLQLAVLLEEIRREGYELLVGKPEVLTVQTNGTVKEPIERAIVDVPEPYVGAVTESLGNRRGQMQQYESMEGDRVRLEFTVPTRGLIGYRSRFQTETRGSGILTTTFEEYSPMGEPIAGRGTGALIADRGGTATSYALKKLSDRGQFFVEPGTECYEGMIVGEHNRKEDLTVNITKEKQLTNFRAAGSDDTVQLEPPVPVDIEFALEWITEDELVEITPRDVRLRTR